VRQLAETSVKLEIGVRENRMVNIRETLYSQLGAVWFGAGLKLYQSTVGLANVKLSYYVSGHH